MVKFRGPQKRSTSAAGADLLPAPAARNHRSFTDPERSLDLIACCNAVVSGCLGLLGLDNNYTRLLIDRYWVVAIASEAAPIKLGVLGLENPYDAWKTPQRIDYVLYRIAAKASITNRFDGHHMLKVEKRSALVKFRLLVPSGCPQISPNSCRSVQRGGADMWWRTLCTFGYHR
jgi:hypothetical protein